MQITLVAAPVLTVAPGSQGRPWKKLEVLYRDMNGKVLTKNLVSFKNPTVFKLFSTAKQDETYEVESVKGEPQADGKQFWEWKSAHRLENQEQGVLPTVDKSGNTNKAPVKLAFTETDRQRLIVRQSSIAQAVNYAKDKVGVVLDDILEVAAQFENWVFRPVAEVESKSIPVTAAELVYKDPQQGATTVTPKRGRPRKSVDFTPAQRQELDSTETDSEVS